MLHTKKTIYRFAVLLCERVECSVCECVKKTEKEFEREEEFEIKNRHRQKNKEVTL